jgi:hypothetical protein
LTHIWTDVALRHTGVRSLHIYDYSIPAQAKHQPGALGFQMQDHARPILHPQPGDDPTDALLPTSLRGGGAENDRRAGGDPANRGLV